jgi:hypothetical protein
VTALSAPSLLTSLLLLHGFCSLLLMRSSHDDARVSLQRREDRARRWLPRREPTRCIAERVCEAFVLRLQRLVHVCHVENANRNGHLT